MARASSASAPPPLQWLFCLSFFSYYYYFFLFRFSFRGKFVGEKWGFSFPSREIARGAEGVEGEILMRRGREEKTFKSRVAGADGPTW